MGRAAHLMTHTVTVAAQSGKANSGDPTFGSQTTISARVEHKVQMVRDPSGREIQANHRVISESEMLQSSRYWLPGDDTTKANEARRAVAVGKADTIPDGYFLYEAWF